MHWCMLSLPKRVFESMMVALLSLKIPCRYHYSLWVEFIQVSISWVLHGTPPLFSYDLKHIRACSTSHSTVQQWQNGWDAISFDSWYSHDIFLLTFIIEAVFCAYEFFLSLLTMQEETNPLWFDNFLPHFGTTANTCIEVPYDHQVVRW